MLFFFESERIAFFFFFGREGAYGHSLGHVFANLDSLLFLSFFPCQNNLGSKSWFVYIFPPLTQLLLRILIDIQVFIFSVGFLFLLSLI